MFDQFHVRRVPAALTFCVGLALVLAACDSSSDDDDDSGSDSITILGVSGDQVNPDGVWFRCFLNDSGDDEKETQTFETDSGILSIKNFTYDSADESCVGNETSTGDDLTVTLGETSDADGNLWSDGSALSGAPLALNGDSLPAQAPGTIIGITAASQNIDGELVRLIDDTGTPMRMYRGHDEPAGDCAPEAEDLAEKCYHSIDFLELEE